MNDQLCNFILCNHQRRYDNQTKTFYGNFEFSPLTINTVYEVKGELFHIPVVGSDVFDGNLGIYLIQI